MVILHGDLSRKLTFSGKKKKKIAKKHYGAFVLACCSRQHTALVTVVFLKSQLAVKFAV